mmetsp:Transcript_128267/g.371325  ORF Transcript_128267/g.371325 Transcript_128267/m.371325 type:complete len:228 (-) Transcript_128267:553-1236(-)
MRKMFHMWSSRLSGLFLPKSETMPAGVSTPLTSAHSATPKVSQAYFMRMDRWRQMPAPASRRPTAAPPNHSPMGVSSGGRRMVPGAAERSIDPRPPKPAVTSLATMRTRFFAAASSRSSRSARLSSSSSTAACIGAARNPPRSSSSLADFKNDRNVGSWRASTRMISALKRARNPSSKTSSNLKMFSCKKRQEAACSSNCCRLPVCVSNNSIAFLLRSCAIPSVPGT